MLDNQTLTVLLFVLPVYQMMFYTIQTVTIKKMDNQAPFFLGLLLLSLTIFLSIHLLLNLGYQTAMLWAYYFYLPAILLVLPLFDSYLLAISGSTQKQKAVTNFIQYLPAFFVFVLNIILFGSLSLGEKIFFLTSELSINLINEVLPLRLLYLLKNGVMVLVMVQTVYCIKKYLVVLKQLKSKKEADAMFLPNFPTKQFNQLLISVIVFVIASVIFVQLKQVNILGIFIYNFVVLFSGFTIGKIALKQVNLHRYVNPKLNEYAIQINNKLKPVNRKITTAESAENQLILASLKEFMISKKPYLNSKLTIDDLANSLKVNKRLLSNIINDETDSNVYGFINQYRIREFKILIQNPKMNHLSIEGLAQKVGFNSKSSFNSCFKKVSGKTPSEYRNEIKKTTESLQPNYF